MFSFLSFLWFIRTTKSIFFWLYLWQLKEYHTGRFLDHFRTEKGRGLFFNLNFGFKIILIPVFFSYPLFVFFVLLLIYLVESAKAILDILLKKLKIPVLTQKTALLILAGLSVEVLAIFVIFVYAENILELSLWLLIADVLAPIFTSLIVLLFQPLAVFGRNQIIKKAKIQRARFGDLLVIGITGSYGKTSTKEFLYTILSEKYKVLKTKEHQNSEIGISQCILNDLKPEHEIFIVEMGAYNRGGIKLLCDITKPKIGILTGINEQHMATFGSLENIIKTKYELIESLSEDGIAFFNAKNKYCVKLYQKTPKESKLPTGQANIKKILYGEEANFPGEENILGAVAVTKELGMTEEEISRAVAKIENKFGGIKIKNGINGLKIIDATYSANPDGVLAHLEYLKNFSGKKVIIMPCLIELGSSSEEVHRRIGKKINEVCDLAIITTKDRFKEIKEAASAKATASQGAEVLFLESPKEIFEKIKRTTQSGDIVLLESRVPKEVIKLLSD